MIRFDFSATSAELIGDQGLKLKELSSLTQAGKDAHSHLLNARATETIGFFELPRQEEMIDEVKRIAEEFEGRFKNIVNLSVGGTMPGVKAVTEALCDPLHNLFKEPRLFFWDSADTDQVAGLLARLDLEETLFIVTSKSGETPETLAGLLLTIGQLKEAQGAAYREHLIFVTDPEQGTLRALAQSEGIRCLSIQPSVGGRFSALSTAGLLPAALVGIDIEALLDGAAKMASACLERGIFSNPAYMYGAIHYLYLQRGVNVSVMMPYAKSLDSLAAWYQQLWGASLGQRLSIDGALVNRGQTAIKALGAADQYGLLQLLLEGPYDKLVNLITVKNYRQDLTIPAILSERPEFAYLGGKTLAQVSQAGYRATQSALIERQRPSITIELDKIDAETVGALVVFFEAAASFAGYLLIVEPFAEKGLEFGRKLNFAAQGRSGYVDKTSVLPKLNDLWFEV